MSNDEAEPPKPAKPMPKKTLLGLPRVAPAPPRPAVPRPLGSEPAVPPNTAPLNAKPEPEPAAAEPDSASSLLAGLPVSPVQPATPKPVPSEEPVELEPDALESEVAAAPPPIAAPSAGPADVPPPPPGMVAPEASAPAVPAAAPAVPAAAPAVPAAVPTPPNAIVPVASDPEHEAPTQLMDAVEKPLDVAAKLGAVDPIVPVATNAENDAPTQLRPVLDQGEDIAAGDKTPLPSWSADLDQELKRELDAQANPRLPPPPQMPSDGSFHPPARSSNTGLFVALGIVGLLVVGVVAIGGAMMYFQTDEGDAPTPTAASAAPATVAKAKAPFACKSTVEAKQLATNVAPRVPVFVTWSPHAERFAVGYSSSEHEALGMKLSGDLSAASGFSSKGKDAVDAVMPLNAGALSFAVTRQGAGLTRGRHLDGEPTVQVGFAKQRLARSSSGKVTPLWPDTDVSKPTLPRTGLVGESHAVVFRSGGLTGDVLFGWLSKDGSRKSDPVKLDVGAPQRGTPTLAAGDDSALIALAAREPDADWGVRLSTAKAGGAPRSAKQFEVPSGGPGGNVIAPSAVALPDGRWLLQWTEGASGAQQVRAQLLDSSLAPVGEALTVSREGKSSGQGAIAYAGGRVVSLFLVKEAASYDLWGAGLACE